jgi:hypothetical protein
MIIPIPVGAMRRAAERARREEEVRRAMAARDGHRCPRCGEVDLPIARRRGNNWVHAVMYLWWIVPGIFYGKWRNKVRYWHCRKCDLDLGPAPPA